MRVALTGATGFVGSHLLEALARRGDTLACLVRTATLEPPLRALGARVVKGDLADERALADLVDGAEVVHHVAGRVAAPSEAEFLRVNRDGTRRVVEAAARAGVRRLVYVSSLAVTGPTVPGRPLDASGPPRPVTAYGRSKQAGEEEVRAGGVPFTIVRPPVVFGPRDREVLRLFRIARTGVVPVLGDGTQELSLVFGPELADALVAAAVSPRTEGGTYHAAHPDVITQRGFVEAIARAVGRRPRVIALPPPVVRAGLRLSGLVARLRGRASVLDPAKGDELLAPAWACTTAELERDAGWRSRVSLEEALVRTARAYRDAGWL